MCFDLKFKANKRRVFLKIALFNLLLCILIMLLNNRVIAKPNFFGVFDTRFVAFNNADKSWLSGGLSPLRFNADSNKLQLGQGIVGANLTFSDYWTLKGYASIYSNNTVKNNLGINELFFTYRPLPLNGYRIEAHVGVFFPELSLENTQPGWTSRYTLTNSAINTWLGEEIKHAGLKLLMKRLGKYHYSEWDIQSSITLFGFNDPAGSLLAWRGWAMHDRQIRVGETVPFAPLPVIQTGAKFDAQSSRFDPFLEIDDRIGYDVSLSLSHHQGLSFSIFKYDNRGDPLVLKNGQYAWHTDFIHASIKLPLLQNITLLAQWLEGSTLMGSINKSSVYAKYQSWYGLLTKQFNDWSFTVRYDDFVINDKDSLAEDNNTQIGNAYTLALGYEFNGNLKVLCEYLFFNESNYARKYFDNNIKQQYSQVQLGLQWRY